ncbi:MAG: hypothetical protein GF398_21405 [Chitinivibrionales bacterium]|nr:hypothetical protein [Chitinivibrionales bacterium]
MISYYRHQEGPPFLKSEQEHHFEKLQFFYPTLRQGLYQYFKDESYRSILLPDYCPQGLFDPFKRLGYDIYFYHVDLSLSLNKEELAETIERTKPDIFVYIHYFGLYMKHNVALLKELLPESTLFIEDFAHTLPTSTTVYTGDLCLFSFTKSLGVAQGALLWFNNEKYLKASPYTPPTKQAEKLSARLRFHTRLEHLFSTQVPSDLLQRILLKVTRPWSDFYTWLHSNYPACTTRVDDASTHALNHLDFDEITAARKKIVERYLNKIPKSQKFTCPRNAFLKQSLIGFPVVVDNQKVFHAELLSLGTQGFYLNKRWWFKDEAGGSELLNRHYLLPVGHYL